MNIKNYRKLLLKSLFCAFIMSSFSNSLVIAQEASDLQDVQQIVAIVNDSVISLYDLKQRTILLTLTSSQRQKTQAEMQQLQSQAMQGLIDEKLKMQEAKKYKADVSNKEAQSYYERYASQFNMNPDELEKALNAASVQKETLLAQIRGTMAWQTVVSGLLDPQVNITDDEVNNQIDTLERNKGKNEYKVSEIFLIITDNEQRDATIATANTIHEQLKQGATFSAVAQQFSQSSTSAVGGDMGWVMEKELPKEVNKQIISMKIGDISEPVISEDGIYILEMTDKRQILTLNNADIRVDLKYMLYKTETDFSDEKFKLINDKVLKIAKNTDNCELVEEKTKNIGVDDGGVLGQFTIGALPIEIREELLSLEIGQATKFYRDPSGYRSFILCVKNIPEVTLPDFETVLENIKQARVQLMARRHLRDLRRDAIIDYR